MEMHCKIFMMLILFHFIVVTIVFSLSMNHLCMDSHLSFSGAWGAPGICDLTISSYLYGICFIVDIAFLTPPYGCTVGFITGWFLLLVELMLFERSWISTKQV